MAPVLQGYCLSQAAWGDMLTSQPDNACSSVFAQFMAINFYSCAFRFNCFVQSCYHGFLPYWHKACFLTFLKKGRSGCCCIYHDGSILLIHCKSKNMWTSEMLFLCFWSALFWFCFVPAGFARYDRGSGVMTVGSYCLVEKTMAALKRLA